MHKDEIEIVTVKEVKFYDSEDVVEACPRLGWLSNPFKSKSNERRVLD